MASPAVLSGWLEKLSGIIFRWWKRKYVVLYRDSELAIYNSPRDSSPETRLQLRGDLIEVETGLACGSINLPWGQSNIDALFCVKTKQHSTVYFVAPSDREASEWAAFIRNAKTAYAPHNTKVPQAPPQMMISHQNFNQHPPPGFQLHGHEGTGNIIQPYHQNQYQAQSQVVNHLHEKGVISSCQPTQGHQPHMGVPHHSTGFNAAPMHASNQMPPQQYQR